MFNLLITIGISFVIITICMTMLGIGWLITGKSKIRLGMCGKIPTQKRNKSKGCGSDQSCPLCGTKNEPDVPEESS